jgi:hypothetical protein
MYVECHAVMDTAVVLIMTTSVVLIMTTAVVPIMTTAHLQLSFDYFAFFCYLQCVCIMTISGLLSVNYFGV